MENQTPPTQRPHRNSTLAPTTIETSGTHKADETKTIDVEVCYASSTQQTLLKVKLPVGATIQQAIDAAHIVHPHPDIDLTIQKVGVFGKIKSLNTVLLANDRVEIYRPLKADPKVARRQRVDKARAVGEAKEGRKWRAG